MCESEFDSILIPRRRSKIQTWPKAQQPDPPCG